MKKRFTQFITAAALMVFSLVALPSVVAPASAYNPLKSGCAGVSGNQGSSGTQGICGTGGAASTDTVQDLVKTTINTIIFVLGMIAVVMIVIGGIRYTTSNGDSSATKGAKDTILYAVVGLVVAILAYAIVNFVLGRFS